jgi:hypothetical protein
MKKQRLLLILFILCSIFLFNRGSSQGFQISPPQLDFDGRQLSIYYDFLNSKQSDQFYVWVEMEKKNGEPILMKGVSGDVGDKIKAGKNKQIKWIPENDSVFLNEMVSVEVKAERYEKSYNKSSMMLLSIVMPGLGQTKISNGKPYWLTGVAAYGALAGGIITHSSYIKSYTSYQTEEDPVKRKNLLDQSQTQMNISGALIITGAALWAANVIWVAMIPNRYQPLKHVKLTLDQPTGPFKGTTLLSLKLNF